MKFYFLIGMGFFVFSVSGKCQAQALHGYYLPPIPNSGSATAPTAVLSTAQPNSNSAPIMNQAQYNAWVAAHPTGPRPPHIDGTSPKPVVRFVEVGPKNESDESQRSPANVNLTGEDSATLGSAQ